MIEKALLIGFAACAIAAISAPAANQLKRVSDKILVSTNRAANPINYVPCTTKSDSGIGCYAPSK